MVSTGNADIPFVKYETLYGYYIHNCLDIRVDIYIYILNFNYMFQTMTLVTFWIDKLDFKDTCTLCNKIINE